MKRLVIILCALLSFEKAYTQDSFISYYPEYRGNFVMKYAAVQAGASIALGEYRSKSFAGSGTTFSFYRGGDAILAVDRFLPRGIRLAPEYGALFSFNEYSVKPLQEEYPEIRMTYNKLYGTYVLGGGVRLSKSFSEKAFLELRCLLHAGYFFPPNELSFTYETDFGEEVIESDFDRSGRFVVFNSIGAQFRFGHLGLALMYDWFSFDQTGSATALNSGYEVEIDHYGRVQNLRVTLVYLMFR